MSVEERAQRLEQAVREIAEASDESLSQGRPVVPVMSRIHRIAVSALDDLLGDDLETRDQAA